MNNKIYRSKSFSSKTADILIYILLAVMGLIAIIPFIHIFSLSFSDPTKIDPTKLALYPKYITTISYKYILSSMTIPRSLAVSIFITTIGTLINLFFTITMAYSLSFKHLIGRRLILGLVTLTLIFNGGMIPTYFVVRGLGLIDSYMSLFFPRAMTVLSLMIFINSFRGLPHDLLDAARIDGMNEVGILIRIVIPLSMPVIATFTVFFGVDHWNRWFDALIYINNSSKWPIQVILRQVMLSSIGTFEDAGELSMIQSHITSRTVQMATTFIATVPILCVYPFLQRYFVKGALIGSVKE